MSNISVDTTPKKKPFRHHGPRRRMAEIKLPDGRVLIPRKAFANETLGETERTTRRRNLPTTYLSGVAYVDRDASLEIIGETVKRRNSKRGRR